MKLLTLLALLSLLAFSAVACGEEEGGGTGSAEQGSGQEFTAQASEICADANEQLSEVQNFAQEGAPIIEEALSNLEGLNPPPDQQETFDRFIQAGRQGLETVQNAEERPQGDPFGEFTRLGEELGIEGGCTRAGEPSGGQPPE